MKVEGEERWGKRIKKKEKSVGESVSLRCNMSSRGHVKRVRE